jgi:AbrB family looped-hinge helix DNA binding protein
MTGVAKVTAKGQTTIPRGIRDALHVAAGDFLAWDVERDGVVRVRRVEPVDVEYLKALETSLTEWSSPEDEEAYGGL